MAAQLNAVAGENRGADDAATNTVERDRVRNTTPLPATPLPKL
jgi:hypothetical protein